MKSIKIRNNLDTKKGFTLIELLVVVAIIGVLAAVGTVAYSGYTKAAKRNATLQQHKLAVRFIKHSFALCDVIGGGTLELNSTRSIDCDVENNAGGVNKMNDVFINYFLDQGFKNPYDNNGPVIIYTGSGGDKIDGRMRLDYETCGGGTKLNLWVKTHKDHLKESFIKDGWCK